MVEDNIAPKGREIGSQVEPDDFVVINVLTRSVSLVIKPPDDVQEIRGSYWAQRVNDEGIVIAEPHKTQQKRMKLYPANEMFFIT